MELLEKNRLSFSFVMGDPLRDEKSCEDLKKLIGHALRLRCGYVQVSIPSAAGIPWLQKLCDHAAERGIGICAQTHGNTIHDTVPHCLDLLKQVNRRNFGFNFETAQLLIQREEIRGGRAVRALGSRISTVCVQNYKLEGKQVIPCLPGDPEGVDFGDLFGALTEIGFDGFVTQISVRYPGMENLEVCRAYIKSLRPFVGSAK